MALVRASLETMSLRALDLRLVSLVRGRGLLPLWVSSLAAPSSSACTSLSGFFGLVPQYAFSLAALSGGVALLITSVCTLWYLPIGTVLSVAEIVLLLLASIRSFK